MIDFFGLFSVNALYVVLGLSALILVLIVLLIVNMVNIKKIRIKYETFMSGENGKNLEKVILKRFKEIDELKAEDKEKTKQIEEINDALRLAYCKTGMVKYDAFNEMGGKLSFALALLDNRNNGFLINAMHSREGCYTYVKEIINGESYINLGEEEKKALTKAVNGEMGEE